MLRIRKEMNVERGREGNTDSNRGLRGGVCCFRLLEGRWEKEIEGTTYAENTVNMQ